MKRKKYIYLLFFILYFLLFACTEKQPFRFTGKTMGTTYSIIIADTLVNPDLIKSTKLKVDDLLKQVNKQMSTWDPNSEISMFNKKTDNEPLPISSDFINVLKLADVIFRESGGAFDPTVGPLVDLWGFGKEGVRLTPPSDEEVENRRKFIGFDLIEIVDDTMIKKSHPETQLDLSAIAKGFGVDKVADLLKSTGHKDFMVEIGGEVVASGRKKSGKWRIGIDRPYFDAVPGQNLEAVIEVSSAGIATSGDYRNYFVSDDKTYSHTIDPVTGRPIVNGVASVTVIAPNCMLADAMATAIMVMGSEKGLKWVRSKNDVEAFIIIRTDEGYEEIFSAGFE
ncbi:MAG: FAD:protein FMN transferase, partial [Calditrichaceae bacterium]|nr:FAD:protein FMN transferase [Calditrichaceae bacterium]